MHNEANLRPTMKRVTVAFLALAAIAFVAFLAIPRQEVAEGPGHVHQEDVTNRNDVINRSRPKAKPVVVNTSDPYWQRALEEIDKSPEEIAAQAQREERQGIYLPKLIRGNPREKLLALTFDDGPHPVFTDKLLALLKQENVKATFFVVGKMVEKNPDLLKDIVRNGNMVGNHTFSHVTLTKIPLNEIRAEYEACNDIVEDVVGQKMRFCRPPGGDYDRHVVKAATEQGLTTVLWTDDPGDYANPGTHTIERKTLDRLSNGGIILLHDGIQETLDVLPQIIAYARDHGYRFVTVDELLNSLNPTFRYNPVRPFAVDDVTNKPKSNAPSPTPTK
jgi:peptidoglycan/xylan/chitin deacetylase (PgdA/CDA1 family)